MSTVAVPRGKARTRAKPRAKTQAKGKVRTASRARAASSVGTSSTATLLAATVAVLNLAGVVMVLSASSVASLYDYGSPWYFFLRQLLWTIVGVAAFVVAIRFDYHRLRRYVKPLLVLSAVLLVVVLVPGIGVYVSGSRRWIGAGMFRFQPTELAKLSLLLYAADLASRRARDRRLAPGREAAPRRARHLRLPRDARARSRVRARPRAHRRHDPGRRRRAPEAPGGGGGRRHLARHDPRDRRAVPPCPVADVPAPVRRSDERGVPDRTVADRDRERRLDRRRARRRARQVELPPERAHRLHLRGDRRGARPDRVPARAGVVRRVHHAGRPHRAARAGPLRRTARGRDHDGNRGSGRDQHRRGGRPTADHRYPAAVHVLRGDRAGDDHVRGRHPRQRRAADPSHRARRPAAAAR